MVPLHVSEVRSVLNNVGFLLKELLNVQLEFSIQARIAFLLVLVENEEVLFVEIGRLSQVALEEIVEFLSFEVLNLIEFEVNIEAAQIHFLKREN